MHQFERMFVIFSVTPCVFSCVLHCTRTIHLQRSAAWGISPDLDNYFAPCQNLLPPPCETFRSTTDERCTSFAEKTSIGPVCSAHIHHTFFSPVWSQMKTIISASENLLLRCQGNQPSKHGSHQRCWSFQLLDYKKHYCQRPRCIFSLMLCFRSMGCARGIELHHQEFHAITKQQQGVFSLRRLSAEVQKHTVIQSSSQEDWRSVMRCVHHSSTFCTAFCSLPLTGSSSNLTVSEDNEMWVIKKSERLRHRFPGSPLKAFI